MKEYPNGLLMPAELSAQIRDKYYHVDIDPFTNFGRKALNFRRRDIRL
ncbi:MAG: hypothetical protein IJT58_03070 [Synergistaceae bacterium]|nr:hypothetical protein [Synergistaceae bacterium]